MATDDALCALAGDINVDYDDSEDDKEGSKNNEKEGVMVQGSAPNEKAKKKKKKKKAEEGEGDEK